MQFIHAVKWMRTFQTAFASVIDQLRGLLEELMAETRRH